MRNRLFRENRAEDCQEMRRICCEETDRARQMRIDELSMQQEMNLIHDPEQRAALERPRFSVNP